MLTTCTKRILLAGAILALAAPGPVAADDSPMVEIKGGKVKVKSGGSEVDVEKGTVKVKSKEGKETKVGASNTGAAVAAGPQLFVQGNSRLIDEDCAGRNVLVQGNSHTITLRGNCGDIDLQGNSQNLNVMGAANKVAISGNSHLVHVNAASTIAVAGNSNIVTWTSGKGSAKPKITKAGRNNSVQQKTE